ncbi:holin [Corynebacterium poyangense]|uniref:Holin n=1 Tax=Corynebacterium poyangense TaxID=2684405 RepID=A0A7H0SQ82_9CORY|nr:holin [Corynebacterium poyangense]QNQ90707.1 holin [Corynebacterium poyangense]
MFTKQFGIDLAERAIKTFAQALIATIAVGTPIFAIDWQSGIGVAATAAVLSILTSIGSAGIGDRDTAAMLPTGENTAGRHSL